MQLNTQSKLFCGCKNATSEEPNIFCCPVCTGMPGSKPVLNKEVIVKALKFALAIGSKINKTMFFSRKTYFYPDLPNNYQITQYELPIAEMGKFEGIRITRVHIEEDPGKLFHKQNFVLVDYNRSGTPLIEVVTEPDLKSPQEARLFLQKLVVALEYLGIYSRTSESILKCDANISLDGGLRVEIKNISGAKEVERALSYEAERQKEEKVMQQETRKWDAAQGITLAMRTKEMEDDYGYIAEPNLPIIKISDVEIRGVKKHIPEMPREKAQRFVKNFKISTEEAEVLVSDLRLALVFEKVAGKVDPVLVARWLRRDLVKVLSEKKMTLKDSKVTEEHLSQLLELFGNKKINDKTAKILLEKLVEEPFDVKKYVKEHKLEAVSDTRELEVLVKKVMEEHLDSVKDYLGGNEKALNFLMGKVMRETKGRASPDITKQLIKKLSKK